MAVFMLETDALTSASSAISSLASQVNEVSNSINIYDTSCEDGFDFAGAKSVLASNVEACSTKITNTASILENVVSAHTELQSSMKFDGSGNTSDSGGNTSDSGGNTSDSGGNTSDSSSSSSSGVTSSGSVSSGSVSSGSSSSGSYSVGGYSGAAVSGRTVSDLVTEKVKDSNNDKVKEASSKDEKETDKNKETNDRELTGILEEKVTTELKDVNYAYINSDKVTDKSKELFNDATFNYDSNTGYALVDGKYVIACDSSVGEVGDIIKFSQKDGSTVECVVGTNTVTDASKNVINFIVDKENWANKTPMSISENLINNTTTITNAGQYNVKPSGTVTTLINENANTSKDISSSSTTDVKEV